MGDERQTAELGYCLVTGGAGFLGRNLAYELIRRGHRVRVFDCAPIEYAHERLDVMRGDVRNYEEVRKACEGIETVFHTAAALDFVGYASPERRAYSRAVNVGGVENLVAACVDAGVRRMVYTSSNNVTFGDAVIDGDELRPYAPHPVDLYTETKIEGERVALQADGLGDLHTCALRPGGIYGPGEKLMLARVVEECASGRFVAIVGDGSALSDNVYVENLVDAQIEAARHLVPGAPVCGQAYFVSDGHPINYFEFFRPIVENLGFRFPRLRIPAGLLRPLVTVWEFLHHAIRVPRPFLTRLELRKLSVSHYNRIEKAHRDFGWTPKVSPEEAMDECMAYCRDLFAEREVVDRPHWGWWLSLPLGMLSLGVLVLDGDAYAWWSHNVSAVLPRWLLACVFGWALLVHVYKGMKAVRLAERAGLHATSLAWGWQTFLLGFASLSLLQRRISRRAEPAADAR